MNQQLGLDYIAKRLDQICGFLVVREDGLGEAQKLGRLLQLGLDRGTIANVLGMTENALAIRIHRKNKKGHKRNNQAT